MTQGERASGEWTSATDRVRWGDVDYARIVRYDAFARYYDLGEATLLRAAGFPLRETIDAHGLLLPRRAIRSEFLAPARLDDALEVRTSIAHVGTTSFTFRHEIAHVGGIECARTEITVVCVGGQDLKKRPLPPELVRALAPFVRGPATSARRPG